MLWYVAATSFQTSETSQRERLAGALLNRSVKQRFEARLGAEVEHQTPKEGAELGGMDGNFELRIGSIQDRRLQQPWSRSVLPRR